MGRHTRVQTAENMVYVDRQRPSHIVLPSYPSLNPAQLRTPQCREEPT